MVNNDFLKLEKNYLFQTIGERVKAFLEKRPGTGLIKMGIGDVTKPLVPAVIAAMHKAVDEMGTPEGFRGYEGSGVGYEFLRGAITRDYAARSGVELDIDEIFVSDGAKCDVANVQELFSPRARAAIQNPVYPVYLDSNLMAGRTVHFMDCMPENKFFPALPKRPPAMIYLCYPNNPTGIVATRKDLRILVDYALHKGAVIFFDGAYEGYITDSEIPHSIYEIPGADMCAIEFRSFSKLAGFTGLRCAYCVVPKRLRFYGTELNPLWRRRTQTKFNGVSYVTQRAAEAVFTHEGITQVKAQVMDYMTSARLIVAGLSKMGFQVYGGTNAPYIWVKAPGSMSSWDFFDRLLGEANVIGTPGSGFGSAGEGFLRLTAFSPRSDVAEALERIEKVSW